MCSKKLSIGLLVLLVASCSPAFAWYSPAKTSSKIEVAEAIAEDTILPLEESEKNLNVAETEPSEEQSQLSEITNPATESLSESLNDSRISEIDSKIEALEKKLKDNKVKEDKFLSELNEIKEYSALADAQFEELNDNYEALKEDYAKASAVASKYKKATGFVQVNALMKDFLHPVFGAQAVVGARIGHLTTQLGAGYWIEPANMLSLDNMFISAGIGWEF